MPYIGDCQVGKLKLILKKEHLIMRDLHNEMIKQCKQLGVAPVTRSVLSKIGFGDNPDHRVSTYLKVLNALNSLRRRSEPYTLNDLIEEDEILKAAKVK
jgi:hypothetical protein